MLNKYDYDAPVHGSSSSAHEHKTGDATAQLLDQCDALANTKLRLHGSAEHSRRLCIAVDDFGLDSDTCAAAISLSLQGRAQAISCMVGAPAWPKWAPQLQECDPNKTELGLHFDLTQYPLTMRPYVLGPLILSCWLRTISRVDIRAEIRAQLDAFEKLIGSSPAYVDGHQHVHQFPVVRDELLSELGQRYKGRLPWLRSTREYTRSSLGFLKTEGIDLKPRIIEALGASAFSREANRLGFRQNAHLLGVHGFRVDESNYLACVDRWLQVSEDGDLLMCHPSLGAHSQEAVDFRLKEYNVISGGQFGVLLAEHCIRLETMRNMLE